MSSRSQNILLRDSTVRLGYVKVECPMYKCTYAQHFIETLQTLTEKEGSHRRQREYLRLGHLAGRHRQK